MVVEKEYSKPMETTRLECVDLANAAQGSRIPFATLLSRFLSPTLLRFVRFGMVGGSGVLVNMAVLWLLHDEFALALEASSLTAISLAIVNNFLWNNFWTFKASGIKSRRVIQFVLISLGGMLINFTILRSLVHVGVHYLPGNLTGIMLATAWNFFGNSRWTWGDM